MLYLPFQGLLWKLFDEDQDMVQIIKQINKVSGSASQLMNLLFPINIHKFSIYIFNPNKFQIIMQPHIQNQLFIFQDDEAVVEDPTPQELPSMANHEKIEAIQLNDQSERGEDLNEHYEQIVSPNFHSLPSNLKGQRIMAAQANPKQQKQPQESNLVFMEQNAYSFRKNEFEVKTKNKPKQIGNQLGIISDFDSEISKNEALIQGQQQDTSGISRNRNQRSRRSKNRSKFQDINDEISVTSSKHADKILQYNEPKKMIPNILNEKGEKEVEVDQHKTEDYLHHDKNDHAEIIQSISAINKSRKRQKALPSIVPHKPGQIFINTSGILQNQSSMVALKPKQDYNKLSMTNMSSLTQMIHTNQNDAKKISEKVVPLGKTFKCMLQRQKMCCISYWHPIYSFYYKNQKLVLNAKKQCGRINSHYNISSEQKQFGNGSQNYTGFLKGNFTGSIFNLYQRFGNIQQIVCTIAYQTQFACSSSFRKIDIYVKSESCTTQSLYRGNNQNFNLKQLYYLGQNAKQRKILKLINKKPEYNEELGMYSMNFKGKCKMASVKNAVFVSQEEPNRYVLLFCKTDHHNFHTEISYPLSPFIAMGIVLSSFDFKLFCQ